MASTSYSTKTSAKATAGDVLLDYLRLQLTELRDNAVHVRDSQPDAVHQMRTSARRLRSALANGKVLFDDGDASVGEVRSGLKWLTEVLGKARDPEVTQERLATMLQQEPAHLDTAAAQQRLQGRLDAEAAKGRDLVLAALDSERYARLVQAAGSLVAEPSLSGKAFRKPRKTLLKLVATDIRRLRRKAEVLQTLQKPQNMQLLNQHGPQSPSVRDVAFHDVRKAAKRVRYAAEAASPVARRAKKLEKAAQSIQKILGLHQDSVVARALLVELGTRAAADGAAGAAEGFIFGRLHAREERRATKAEKAYSKAWKKARKRFRDSAPL